MSKLDSYKDVLLYETQRQFYNERGRGARYRLTAIGVSWFEKEIKDLKDTAGLVNWLKDNDFCQAVDMADTDEGIALQLNITGCALRNITENWIKDGRQPLNCPIANIIMKSMEFNGSMPPELCPIEFDGPACKIKMAKIFTSDVVDEVK